MVTGGVGEREYDGIRELYVLRERYFNRRTPGDSTEMTRSNARALRAWQRWSYTGMEVAGARSEVHRGLSCLKTQEELQFYSKEKPTE